jgi:flavin reductase (DIM6/NTAB) family NADH-FMN oxidoreductase RutF
MGLIHRPVSVEKHTYENIKSTGCFTINHVPKKLYKNAHQTSARYDRETSEFEACGFTPEVKGNLIAPYVAESYVQIGLTLEEEIKITSNDTLLLVGSIKEIYLAPGIIDEEGYIELAKANTILVQGLETYYSANYVERLPYAKP